MLPVVVRPRTPDAPFADDAALAAALRAGDEAARAANELRRSLENSLKRINGQQIGLLHQSMLEKKQADERALKGAIAANAEWSCYAL